MANTYKKIYIHIVFAVKHRACLIDTKWSKRLYAYVATTLNNRGNYSLAVDGHLDHIHIFFDYSLNEPLSDLVREIKKSSTKFIQENYITKQKFQWQAGYGAFSVGHTEKDKIIKYIINQEEHHKKKIQRRIHHSINKI